jgi:hypothetical protein
MELVTTTLNNLPIVVLVSAALVFVKETLFNFLSLEFVKQTLKTVFGLTPREAGELIALQAKHIAVIIKTSAALVVTVLKSAFQLLQYILPEKLIHALGIGFNTTADILVNGYIVDFFVNMMVKFITGLGKLLKLIIHLVPQLFTFLETILQVFYMIGQGFYAVFSVFNKGVETATSAWHWLMDPPVNSRIIIIGTILLFSFILTCGVKCLAWAKKKVD